MTPRSSNHQGGRELPLPFSCHDAHVIWFGTISVAALASAANGVLVSPDKLVAIGFFL
jgi:hypothetical protein